jgi:hypothetical protein
MQSHIATNTATNKATITATTSVDDNHRRNEENNSMNAFISPSKKQRVVTGSLSKQQGLIMDIKQQQHELIEIKHDLYSILYDTVTSAYNTLQQVTSITPSTSISSYSPTTLSSSSSIQISPSNPIIVSLMSASNDHIIITSHPIMLPIKAISHHKEITSLHNHYNHNHHNNDHNHNHNHNRNEISSITICPHTYPFPAIEGALLSNSMKGPGYCSSLESGYKVTIDEYCSISIILYRRLMYDTCI